MNVRTRVGSPVAVDPMRTLALLATVALIGAYSSVFYGLVDVAGDTTLFAVVFLGSLAGGTALARHVRAKVTVLVAGAVLVVGLAWYVISLSHAPRVGPLLVSNVELLSGQSLHQIRESGTWAVAVLPAPVLVTWYLALRRQYAGAAGVGLATLGYVVLTGDAVTVVTVLGMVGVAGLLGFGDLDRRSGTVAGAEHVAVVLAVMVVVPFAVSVVPGAVGSPVAFDRADPATMESNLLDDQRQLTVSGEVSLSPNVRFTVESPVDRYWKTNSFDRYTGEGWVRTGGTVPLEETRLSFPPGPRQTVRQTVEAESRMTSLPAAWRPVDAGGSVAERTAVTEEGDVTATRALEAGDTYTVTSAILAERGEQLRRAGRDYPSEVRERYTRLPGSTPDRVGERTAAITENADSPYETAVAIETWLEGNREYSLSVERPDDRIADAFLFEMDAGYCTYFATTMVVMLRSEGVPARLATGYTPGQQVDEDRYVVRGLDAHSWVEVYVEGHGWVTFDPTPADSREDRETERIAEARENNVTEADTEESQGRSPTSPDVESQEETEPVSGGPEVNTSRIPENIQGSLRPADPASTDADDGRSPFAVELPPRQHLALGAVVLVGAIAGLRRSRLGPWARRTAAVHWQRRADPETDVERAFERVSILLERNHRPRRRGETVRAYVDAIDPPEPARRVAEIRERVRYGETVDADLADEAVGQVDRLRAEYDRSNGASRGPEW